MHLLLLAGGGRWLGVVWASVLGGFFLDVLHYFWQLCQRGYHEISVLHEIAVTGGSSEQDGAGTGTSSGEQVEEVVSDDEGIGGVDGESAAGVEDGEGIGLGRAILSGDDAVEGQVVFGADALDAVAAVTGGQGEGALTLAAVVDDFVDAGIELGIKGGVQFVLMEDFFSVAAFLGFHALHGFEDGAGGQSHFGTDLVEVQARTCDGAVEIEDNRSNSHSAGIVGV